MTTVKTKKRCMYATFAAIFIAGGIEYAVVLPTLWLYLHNTYNAPQYMLGLVLSAYSLAAFLSSPIFGRLSDRVGHTKEIFLFCSFFELAGSFLYFIGISPWLCVASRFIAGIGASSESIALAEVSRYTSENERTGIISKLVASRQTALLIGPALNLFLRIADFKIGPFDVNKYSAPGAFMVVMWVILIVIILFLYNEPKQIYAQEKLERRQAKAPKVVAVSPQEEEEDNLSQVHSRALLSEPHTHHKESEHRKHDTDSMTEVGADKPPHDVANLIEGCGSSQEELRSKERQSKRELIQSDDGTDFVYPPLIYVQRNVGELGQQQGVGEMESSSISKPVLPKISESDSQRPESLRGSENVQKNPSTNNLYDGPETKTPDQSALKTPSQLIDTANSVIVNNNQGLANGEIGASKSEDYSELSCSLNLMISAERLINNTQFTKASTELDGTYKTGAAVAPSLVFADDHFGLSVDNFYTDIAGESSNADEEEKALNHAHVHNSQPSLSRQGASSGTYIERSYSAIDDPVAREGKLGFFCNEYIRDEIVALICLLFCTLFSQICVETMVLPLSKEYLDFGELENSLLYCGCGIEIIIVFIFMTWLSRRISDRVLIVFGCFTLLASNLWLVSFLPELPLHNRAYNMPYLGVAVVLDVLSMPFLLVCCTSLYSKLTRKETQGLSQGVRRCVVGLGTIIAPMWGSSAAARPRLTVGVLAGLQGLSLALILLSFKRLKVTRSHTLSESSSISPSVIAAASVNVNPLDLPVPVSNGRDSRQSNAGHSTPYGSIQRSIDGMSYHSVEGASDEEQPLLSHQTV